MQGGGGDHRQPPEGKYPPPRHPTWVLRREGNRDGDLGDEADAGVR